MRRAVFLSALVAGALFMSPRAAAACTCGTGGPACKAYGTTQIVFDATVRSVDGGMATLDVLRVWKGTVASAVTAPNGPEASCIYQFKAGARYLVFASNTDRDRTILVSLCSPTHEWDGSGPDGDFLHSLSRPATGGRIFGSVRRFTRPGGGVPAESPMVPADAELRLTTPAGISTVTSKNGDFQFTGLAPGTYQLSIVVPENLHASPVSVDVELRDARDCSQLRFELTDNGRIAGRLVATDGSRIPNPRLELVTEEALSRLGDVSPREAFFHLDGSFEFGELPPGKYVIGVNLTNILDRDNPYSRTLYSGEGSGIHVFTVQTGERVDIGTWRLPPSAPSVAVSGVVTWEDGRPAADVRIYALDSIVAGLEASSAVSGPDGRFTIQLWQQRLYRFRAELSGGSEPIFVAAPTLTPGAEAPAPIRIVVRRAPRQ